MSALKLNAAGNPREATSKPPVRGPSRNASCWERDRRLLAVASRRGATTAGRNACSPALNEAARLPTRKEKGSSIQTWNPALAEKTARRMKAVARSRSPTMRIGRSRNRSRRTPPRKPKQQGGDVLGSRNQPEVERPFSQLFEEQGDGQIGDVVAEEGHRLTDPQRGESALETDFPVLTPLSHGANTILSDVGDPVAVVASRSRESRESRT